MMFFEGGIPSAVAIVSPLNEGSRTTNAPCTPLSENKHYTENSPKRLRLSEITGNGI